MEPMTQISLSKIYAIIDEHRGRLLDFRKCCVPGSEAHIGVNNTLRLLNRLKKEFALVSDADQLPLGL